MTLELKFAGEGVSGGASSTPQSLNGRTVLEGTVNLRKPKTPKQLAEDADRFAKFHSKPKRSTFRKIVDYVKNDFQESYEGLKSQLYPMARIAENIGLVLSGFKDNSIANDVAEIRDVVEPWLRSEAAYERLYDPYSARAGKSSHPVTMTGNEGNFVPVKEAIANTLDTFGDSVIEEFENVHNLNADPSNRQRDTPLMSSSALKVATYGVRTAVVAGLLAIAGMAAVTKPMIDGVYQNKQLQLIKQADAEDAAMNYRIPNPAFLEWKLGEKRERGYISSDEKFVNAGIVAVQVPDRYLKISIYDYPDWSKINPTVKVINPAYAEWHDFAEKFNDSIDQGKVPTQSDINRANNMPQMYLNIASADFPKWARDHPEYESIYNGFSKK